MNTQRRGTLVIGKSLGLTALVYLLMFVSHDTFFFGTNANYTMTTIPRYVMAVFIAVTALRVFMHRLDRNKCNTLLFGMLMICLYIVLAIYHREYMQVTSIKLLCMTGALFFVLQYDFADYKEAFIKAMVINAIAAIILEIMVYASHGLALALPRMTNTAGVQITTIGVAGIDSGNLSSVLIRNGGIFWEPGVFQMYLNLAIIMLLFGYPEIRKKTLLILSLGVFITFSTTGFIVYGWIMVSYFFLKRKKVITAKTAIAMVSFLIIAVGLFFVIDFTPLTEIVFGKLSDSASGSTVARKASVFVNLQMAWEHPLTGVGNRAMLDEMTTRSLAMFGKSTTHNTNTLLFQFGSFGAVFGALFTYGTFRFTGLFSRKALIRIALFAAIVLIYVGENLKYSMLPYLLIFYGIRNCEGNQDVYA